MPNDGWRHDTVLAAAEAGDTDGVRALVDRGALINATREDKSCPLLLAAKGGHVDCCALLLELGADHSQAKEGGATPVFAAAAANVHREEAGAAAGSKLSTAARPLSTRPGAPSRGPAGLAMPPDPRGQLLARCKGQLRLR